MTRLLSQWAPVKRVSPDTDVGLSLIDAAAAATMRLVHAADKEGRVIDGPVTIRVIAEARTKERR